MSTGNKVCFKIISFKTDVSLELTFCETSSTNNFSSCLFISTPTFIQTYIFVSLLSQSMSSKTDFSDTIEIMNNAISKAVTIILILSLVIKLRHHKMT